MKNSLNFANTCLKVVDTRRCERWIQIEFVKPLKHFLLKSPRSSLNTHYRMMTYVQKEVSCPI